MRQLANIAALVRLLLLVLAATSLKIWAAADDAPSEAAAAAGDAQLAARSANKADGRSLEKRHADIERRLARQYPVAVRKMSEDPSEMFFPEYWQFDFEPNEGFAPESTVAEPETAGDWNTSTSQDFFSPLLSHRDDPYSATLKRRSLSLNFFKKRDYQCPSGYHDCSSIGFQDSCCSQGQSCQIIRDTGVGVVGCCPRGTQCKGSVSNCDESQGYTSCPLRQNPNGCCAPGFECDAIGCVRRNKATTVQTRPTTVSVPTQTQTQTRTVFTTTTYPTSTRTVGPVVQSDQTTTISSLAPPVEPTTLVGYCPTGFYRCSAFYEGGCCRVGRDCRSTNCPLIVSAQATENGVVTVVVATGEGVTTIARGGGALPTGPTVAATTTSSDDQSLGSGPCAAGWYKCGADGGGGCCPDGYRCAAKCIATQSGLSGSVLKAPPENHARDLDAWGKWMIALAGAIGLAMVWL